jgi:small neutral amino acid transporter SnatA (MarC family)
MLYAAAKVAGAVKVGINMLYGIAEQTHRCIAVIAVAVAIGVIMQGCIGDDGSIGLLGCGVCGSIWGIGLLGCRVCGSIGGIGLLGCGVTAGRKTENKQQNKKQGQKTSHSIILTKKLI